MKSLQALAAFREESSKKATILVIDDSACIVDMLSWALRLRGYQPVCTANGQEACEWLENVLPTGQYPTAILLDICMPAMDGPTFLQRLRSRWNACWPIPAIILLTEEQRDYDYLACSAVLLKPFHITELYKHLDPLPFQ